MKICTLNTTLFIIFSILLFSCKENNSSPIQSKQIITKKIAPLVIPSEFHTLVWDLHFNTDSFKTRKIKSHIATQTMLNSKNKKVFYHAYINEKGKLKFYELLNKDTIISQRISTVNPSDYSTNLRFHTTNQQETETFFLNPKNEPNKVVYKSKGKLIDSMVYIYKNSELIKILQPNHDIEYFTKKGINTEITTFINAKKDTLYQFIDSSDSQKLLLRKYTKGMSHRYVYYYDSFNRISKIVWFENHQKINATIIFDYNSDGLLKKRTIQSTIAAFGNSETTYNYFY